MRTFFTDIAGKIKTRKWELALLVIFIAVGIFLRTYNFTKWLHFEIDQSYDILLVSPAVENGPSNLPLLGPTAGGGRALRLGPGFYYLEYLAAKIFGDTPQGHASLVLVFSILSLPLFYLFMRRCFSKPVSLTLFAAYSFSFFSVIYSRFSWSPNVLPFLLMLSFYSLLRGVDKEEKHQKTWFLVSAVSLAITTQIHYNTFFVLPPVVMLFLLIKRPHLKARVWLASAAIVATIYSPMVFSDLETHGQNIGYFTKKITSVSAKGRNAVGRLTRETRFMGSWYFMTVSGLENSKSVRVDKEGATKYENMFIGIFSLAILVIALVMLIYALVKSKPGKRKDFLTVSLLWFVISWFYFFSVSSGVSLKPRFILSLIPLPFVLAGILIEKIYEATQKKLSYSVLIILVILSALGNGSTLWQYFDQLKKVDHEPLEVETEDVFPDTARVTLAQQYAIVDYIESIQKTSGYPVYLQAKHEYEPVFWYHLEKRGIFFNETIRNDRTYKEAEYFLVNFPNQKLSTDYLSRFDIAEKKDFGALLVYHLVAKPERITDEKQVSPKETPIQKLQIAQILTWKKMFSTSTSPAELETAKKNLEKQESNALKEDASQGLSNGNENTDPSLENGSGL